MIVLCWIIFAHFALSTDSRVFYIDDRNIEGNYGIGYDNIIPDNIEQSSRDLDLSFSTGDTSNDDYYHRDNYPILKRVNQVRPYDIPERQYFDMNKDVDRPRSYYKFVKVPDRRSKVEEIIVEPNRNPKFIETPRDRKGEVILELRVITNNDAI